MSYLAGSIWGARVERCKCNQRTLAYASSSEVHMPLCPPFQETGGCEEQLQGLVNSVHCLTHGQPSCMTGFLQPPCHDLLALVLQSQ